MILDRSAIARLIPHAGTMCLLDGVLAWDAVLIRCLSRRYAQADNPLRRQDGTLGTASGIEIVAQAMAVHGRLLAGNNDRPAAGYLTSVREVQFSARCLAAAAGDLTVEAELLRGEASGATYRFALTRDGAALLTGRATALLEVPA